MPELPEIETVKRGISSLSGQTIKDVKIRHERLRYPLKADIKHQLAAKKIVNISRRAKYLILELTKGYLIIHLGMSGHLRLLMNDMINDEPLLKHDHFDLITDNYTLRYNDPRRFGLIVYADTLAGCNLLSKLGPEPLTPAFNAKYILDKLKDRKSPIKALLMQNEIVVGVGNIYACEALFNARIAPFKPGNSINFAEAVKLVKAIKDILNKAINAGGSTLRDYKKADGKKGGFQHLHKVYGRSGKPCPICNSKINELRIAQRNSFYCPNCQHWE